MANNTKKKIMSTTTSKMPKTRANSMIKNKKMIKSY